MTRSPEFQVYPSRDRYGRRCWRWRLVAANGEKLAQSQAYPTSSHAVRGVNDAQAAATLANIRITGIRFV